MEKNSNFIEATIGETFDSRRGSILIAGLPSLQSVGIDTEIKVKSILIKKYHHNQPIISKRISSPPKAEKPMIRRRIGILKP